MVHHRGPARKRIARKRFGAIVASPTFLAIAARSTIALVSVSRATGGTTDQIMTPKSETWKATKCNTVGTGEMKTFVFETKYTKCNAAIIQEKQYANNGAPHLTVVDAMTGEPLLTVTTNIPGYRPEPGYVVIKDWSENEGVLAALFQAGIIGAAESVVPAGYCKAFVCKYKGFK
jgi:hypothetical protein